MTGPDRPSLSRRALILRGAALVAAPIAGLSLATTRALGQQTEADVVIIGAGAAGIAAARKVAEAGRTYTLIEASRRVGGRTYTDTSVFGRPFDMGARYIRVPGAHPLSALGRKAGLDIVAAPEGGRLYLGGKEASDAQYEAFVAAVRRAERAIVAAGDAGRDLPAAQVLPDLGSWSDSARFVVGPLRCAKELEEVSTVDVSRAEEPDGNDLCRQGLGTLVARLAAPLSVQLETVARSVDLGGRLVAVQTNRGTLVGRLVILAVPPSMIATGKLRILPQPPSRYRAAIGRVTLGAYDHIAFEMKGNPGGLNPDEFIYFKPEGGRAFALAARLDGSDLYSLEVAGEVAQELAEAPAEAARAFLAEAVAREFGSDAARRIAAVHQTRWTKDPFALGAFSCALPGAGNLRRAFLEVVGGRLMFAGEHAHETLWGTVGGAWLSGERAAGQALGILNGGRAG